MHAGLKIQANWAAEAEYNCGQAATGAAHLSTGVGLLQADSQAAGSVPLCGRHWRASSWSAAHRQALRGATTH